MRRLISCVVLALGLIVSTPSAQGEEEVSLTFGLYQSDKATVMYRKFSPVIDAIVEQMEASLGCSVDIQIQIFKTYNEANDALVEGSVDFVRFGPASYIIAHERNPEIELLAMESKGGKKRFDGVIAVRDDSSISSVEDLHGHTFAFGDPNSTIGRYLAQSVLIDNGVFAADLASFEFLGRHDKVFKAIEVGDFDAGAMKISTYHSMNKNDDLRVIATFENVTKPWVRRADLDPDIADAITEALLELTDPEALKQLKASGFFPTSDEEYAFVREGMHRSESFVANDTETAQADSVSE